MGVEGLEPSRPFKVNGFSFSCSFRYCLMALRIGLSLYPRLDVRVAPVESLHLPNYLGLGSGLPCLRTDLGFPEFESIHLKNFFFKAQLFKSVASAIPPHPPIVLGLLYFLEVANTPSSIPPLNAHFVQQIEKFLS